MELFARFSYGYAPGEQRIKNDDELNQILNTKLSDFINKHGIVNYRILNAQIAVLPKPTIGPGIESVLCSLFIAYTLPK